MRRRPFVRLNADANHVSAIVCRGGRVDLAELDFGEMAVPTLLIVGGADTAVLELNRRVLETLAGPAQLAVVPGAGHLFEESGALERVAELACDWFTKYLLVDKSVDTSPVASSMRVPERSAQGEIATLATPLRGPIDLTELVERVGGRRYVCIGEASHGTHEYYWWRGELSKRLIAEKGFNWIGVEGDWPDCWRINQWVRGQGDDQRTARELLGDFERWPTWMWANVEVSEFITWLREWNRLRPSSEQVGFYGLDVYSLWDSLRVVMGWLHANAPEAVSAANEAWQCFDPYGEDPQRYAWATRLVPQSCEGDVVDLLVKVRSRASTTENRDDAAFDAVQNAEVAAGAERYYRTMVRGDRESWNVRDVHMADTVDRLSAHLGPTSKGLLWEHNTHVGDARATDMASAGMVNVGQLIRERHATEGVALVGMASYAGTVLAASSWGENDHVMSVPRAAVGSHEDLLHETLGAPAVVVFGDRRSGPWLAATRGHRAIGVVYNPDREFGNYVPTVMGARYDALLWFERSRALTPLHHELPPEEPEYETEPTGY